MSTTVIENYTVQITLFLVTRLNITIATSFELLNFSLLKLEKELI